MAKNRVNSGYAVQDEDELKRQSSEIWSLYRGNREFSRLSINENGLSFRIDIFGRSSSQMVRCKATVYLRRQGLGLNSLNVWDTGGSSFTFPSDSDIYLLDSYKVLDGLYKNIHNGFDKVKSFCLLYIMTVGVA
jgi:hypothetical protein